jgi:hypothetical protein
VDKALALLVLVLPAVIINYKKPLLKQKAG